MALLLYRFSDTDFNKRASMFLTPPSFWDQPGHCLGRFLEPMSWLYQGGATLHQLVSLPYQAQIPVISIGNFVMGGAGKTPVTKAIAQQLQSMGRTPHIISRGYGGSCRGPIQVDSSYHSFDQVGDEPLLLAKVAPTWVSKNRRAAADLACQEGADILLLDDGHQNHSLKKDLSFMVVNTAQGFGNGRVFPAGPLRQSISTGLKYTDVLILIGKNTDSLPQPLSCLSCPLIWATVTPLAPAPCAVLAFAGIGHPEKFRQTLIEAGYDVKALISFPDHYPYTSQDLQSLQEKAFSMDACLITTEKDALRLPPYNQKDVLVLSIELTFSPRTALSSLLKGII